MLAILHYSLSLPYSLFPIHWVRDPIEIKKIKDSGVYGLCPVRSGFGVSYPLSIILYPLSLIHYLLYILSYSLSLIPYPLLIIIFHDFLSGVGWDGGAARPRGSGLISN